jgi:predicted nucleic acid-binding protein
MEPAMKVAFDTSVLVAAVLSAHPHHAASAQRLREVVSGHGAGIISTHAVAEFFAVLSAMPTTPRLHPLDVIRLYEESVRPFFTIVPLDQADYEASLQMAASAGRASGAVYDALHLAAARKARCERFYTCNLRHFLGLPAVDALVISGP